MRSGAAARVAGACALAVAAGCGHLDLPAHTLGPYAGLDGPALDQVGLALTRLGYLDAVIDPEAGVVTAPMFSCRTAADRPVLAVRAYREGWLVLSIAASGDPDRCTHDGQPTRQVRRELAAAAAALRERFPGIEVDGELGIAPPTWSSSGEPPTEAINPALVSAPVAELVGAGAIAFGIAHLGSVAISIRMFQAEPCASGGAGWWLVPWIGPVLGGIQVQCPSSGGFLFPVAPYWDMQLLGAVSAVVQLVSTVVFIAGIANRAIHPTGRDARTVRLALGPSGLGLAF